MILKDFISIIDSNIICYLPSDNGRFDYKEVMDFKKYIACQNMQIEKIESIDKNEILIHLKG